MRGASGVAKTGKNEAFSAVRFGASLALPLAFPGALWRFLARPGAAWRSEALSGAPERLRRYQALLGAPWCSLPFPCCGFPVEIEQLN